MDIGRGALGGLQQAEVGVPVKVVVDASLFMWGRGECGGVDRVILDAQLADAKL